MRKALFEGTCTQLDNRESGGAANFAGGTLVSQIDV